MRNCVHHGDFLVFHMDFRLQMVFACIYTYPGSIMLAEFTTQHINWRTEVAEKLPGSVFLDILGLCRRPRWPIRHPLFVWGGMVGSDAPVALCNSEPWEKKLQCPQTKTSLCFPKTASSVIFCINTSRYNWPIPRLGPWFRDRRDHGAENNKNTEMFWFYCYFLSWQTRLQTR